MSFQSSKFHDSIKRKLFYICIFFCYQVIRVSMRVAALTSVTLSPTPPSRCLWLVFGSNAIKQTQTELLKLPWKMLTVPCPRCWQEAALTDEHQVQTLRIAHFWFPATGWWFLQWRLRQLSHMNIHTCKLWNCTLFYQMNFLALKWSSCCAFVWLALLPWV